MIFNLNNVTLHCWVTELILTSTLVDMKKGKGSEVYLRNSFDSIEPSSQKDFVKTGQEKENWKDRGVNAAGHDLWS